MKIDEDLIKEKFEKLIKSNTVHFFKKGERVNNVKCKSIALVKLTFIEKTDGTTQYEASGRGSFLEDLGKIGGLEHNMDYKSIIHVKGDDIIDAANTRVDL